MVHNTAFFIINPLPPGCLSLEARKLTEQNRNKPINGITYMFEKYLTPVYSKVIITIDQNCKV